MLLTTEELIRKFNIAYAQYTTIDKGKCHTVGSLVQGFVSWKNGDTFNIAPFQFANEDEIPRKLGMLDKIKAEEFGVSFVQHYIHYS